MDYIEVLFSRTCSSSIEDRLDLESHVYMLVLDCSDPSPRMVFRSISRLEFSHNVVETFSEASQLELRLEESR